MLYQNPLYKESLLKFISEEYLFPTTFIEIPFEKGSSNEEAIREAIDKHDGLMPVFRSFEDRKGVLCIVMHDIEDGKDKVAVKALRVIDADDRDNAKMDVLIASKLLDREYDYSDEVDSFTCNIELFRKLVELRKDRSQMRPFRCNNLMQMVRYVYFQARRFCEAGQTDYQEMLSLDTSELVHKMVAILEQERGQDREGGRLRFRDMEEASDYILAGDYPKEVKEIVEVERLNRDSYGKMLYYFTYLANFPWNKEAKAEEDLEKIAEEFDRTHYGMKEVKERIIEALIVKKRTEGKNAPILCLVGSPGVGKTSFAKAMAKAMNIPFQKISMSGSNDTRVLKGSNKAYVAASAGAIVNAVNMAGCKNPLILIDEVEKTGSSSEGNPVNVLLEALDPSQNSNFIDDYMTIGIDLSEVTFICTANYPELIPAPLRDRMEIIEMPDYSLAERITIFKEYVMPSEMKKHSLSKDEMVISDELMKYIVTNYSVDGGIRRLEKCAAKLCRKACAMLDRGEEKAVFDRKMIKEYLGQSLADIKQLVDTKAQVGVANAMAVNGLGQGLINKIECAYSRGSGQLNITGNLSQMAEESCRIAMEYVKCIADILGIAEDFFEKHDINVHFTRSAIQKDGNSAGIAFVTAIISAITGRKTIDGLSMTGEISLIGNVSAIGGLRQKIEGAKENGVTTIIYPAENQKDVDKLPKKLKKGISLIAVDNYAQILDAVFA